MKEKIKELIELFKQSKTEQDYEREYHTLIFSSLFFSVISLLLTMMNIIKHYWLMTAFTSILVIGFFISFLITYISKKTLASKILVATMTALIFTIFAITGENEGFAILWIILVPPISMSLIGVTFGTVLSLYFQIFLIVLFYTPLRNTVINSYNSSFIMRFPALYFCSFGSALYLTVQKLYYYLKTLDRSLTDNLTHLGNREKFTNIVEDLEKTPFNEKFTLISLDLNNLKNTNDEIGHEAGDEMIRVFAEKMRKYFSDAITLCRIGGDEFVICINASKEDVNYRLSQVTKNCNNYKGKYVSNITFSYGCSHYEDNHFNKIEDLLKDADSKMYECKKDYYLTSGRNRRRSEDGIRFR